MSFDLIRRVETLGHPRILVVGDLMLDRYVWGDAERISQEAPVILLRADHREHRLGGAASVATMLRALGAEVRLVGVVGDDAEAGLVRKLLTDQAIDDRLVVGLADRPTTVKERYIGRAQHRHPQQMIRVDYETRDPIPEVVEAALRERLPDAIAEADVVLISDYDKGVCTPTLLRRLIAGCRSLDVRVLADPIRSADYRNTAGALHDAEPARSAARHGADDRPARGRAGGRQAAGRDARPGGGPRHARQGRHGPGSRRRPRRARADPAAPGLRHHRRRRHGPVGGRALPGRRGRLRRGGRAGQRRRRPGGREDRRRPADARRRSSRDLFDHHRARERRRGSTATR